MKKFIKTNKSNGSKTMKKCIKIMIVAVLVLMAMVSCSPGSYNGIFGAYLEVTVSGNYFNEVDNKDTTQPEELKAVINLYPESSNKTRATMPGVFDSDSDGVVYSNQNGFDTANMPIEANGIAHVNGFISKGPFKEKSDVRIRILDKNFEEIEIKEEFISSLTTTSDGDSKFKIDLPATKNVTINININSLTFAQDERVRALKKAGKSYYDAYKQSKTEVLNAVGMLGCEDFGEFHKLDIRSAGDEDADKGNGLLVIANALFAENIKDGETSLLRNFMEDLAGDGEIEDEMESTIIEIKENLDIDNIKNNLNGAGIDIPDIDANYFEDKDNDGIPDIFDIKELNPIGSKVIELNAGFTMPSFSWECHSALPAGTKYTLEISDKSDFSSIIASGEVNNDNGNEIEITPQLDSNVSSDDIIDKKWYWRVKSKVGNEQKILASTSFFTHNDPEALDLTFGGNIKIWDKEMTTEIADNGNTTSRHIVIDSTGIEKAPKTMDIHVDNGGRADIDKKNLEFELYRHIILPLPNDDSNKTYKITVEFKNPNADDHEIIKTITWGQYPSN